MNDLNAVQPVDRYVLGLLQVAKKYFKVEIDLHKPTRGQRLEAAFYLGGLGKQQEAMDIMKGQHTSQDDDLAELLFGVEYQSMHATNPQLLREFYIGIPHQYEGPIEDLRELTIHGATITYDTNGTYRTAKPNQETRELDMNKMLDLLQGMSKEGANAIIDRFLSENKNVKDPKIVESTTKILRSLKDKIAQ